MDALFAPDGDDYLPGPLTQGPWAEGAQHGGPPAALMAGVIERYPADSPMETVRLTVELLRPVPLGPLRVETDLVRPGRRVQLVRASLFAGDREVARTVGLRLRSGDDAPALPDEPPPPPPEEGTVPRWRTFPLSGYHDQGVEMRLVGGDPDHLGPSTAWIRLRVPVVAGEETSPLQRVAAVADFGNGISSWLDPQHHTYVNPDLTVSVVRPAVAEWICLEARTWGGGAVGLAESALYDRDGRIGRSVQLLLLAARK